MIRLVLLLAAAPAAADTLIAARTIPAETVLTAADLSLVPGEVPGGLDDPNLAIGKEARVALYAGRPIRAGEIGAPALVERNQIIPLVYTSGGLFIATEGRALGRAGAGESVQVMNLASRLTVTALIAEDGVGYVTP